MKKVIALILALVMALSCGLMAFATSLETVTDVNGKTYYVCKCGKSYNSMDDYNKCVDSHITQREFVCARCGMVFYDNTKYNNHLRDAHNLDDGESGRSGVNVGDVEYHWDKYVGTDVVTLFSNLVDIFQSTGILEMLKNLVEKLWALIEQGINDAKSAPSVAGALSDLEAKVIDLGFGDNLEISGLINKIKEKIKSFYANEKATTVEATVAEAPADTGSATAGIAAFAALSMAAAAAYVCTKKKA